MSIDTITPHPTEIPSWPLSRMTLEQYEAMVESGIFTERDKLQLINGILVAKVDRQIEVYSGPHAAGYAKCEVFGPGNRSSRHRRPRRRADRRR